MASVTARVIGVQQLRGDDDVIGAENANFKVRNYAISIDHNGVQVAGGTDTLDLDVGTALNNQERNGKTVTLRAAALMRPAYEQSGATSFAGTLSLSSNTLSLTPVSSNWSSNATVTAAMKLDRPFVVMVTVNEA